jgi:hypothetical protein
MEVEMGKVKAWVMDMEEDAIDMTIEAWCEKHGESLIEVYHEARRKFGDLPRHGSPEDRGSADYYYGRPMNPHYMERQADGNYIRIGREDMTDEQVQDYLRAYENEDDRKDWGSPELEAHDEECE